ncbi:MAG: hypothetical protein LBB54_04430 [Cellulomonadaceae bacterium]|jgi:hypothetical protein|nr:hypothetical protein [Cellulomonadaceae bacterium]
MNRKRSLFQVLTNIVIIIALVTSGASTWAIIALAALTIPAIIVAVLPEASDGA